MNNTAIELVYCQDRYMNISIKAYYLINEFIPVYLKLMTHGQETCARFRINFYIYVLMRNIRPI